jgi:hypothetical protein
MLKNVDDTFPICFTVGDHSMTAFKLLKLFLEHIGERACVQAKCSSSPLIQTHYVVENLTVRIDTDRFYIL